MKTLLGKDELSEMLRKMNGRRRERLLTEGDIDQVIREALVDGYGYASGGTVAKSYKYRAWTSAVACAKLRGQMYIRMAEIGANGGSIVTWFGPASSRRADCDKWFNEMNSIGPLTWHQSIALAKWMPLSHHAQREARQAVRQIRDRERAEAQQRAAQIEAAPDVLVTKADSLACGNCRHVTERICAAFGTEQMQSHVFLRRMFRTYPELLRFAFRAVEYAAKNQVDVCITGNPAINGVCGDADCPCA